MIDIYPSASWPEPQPSLDAWPSAEFLSAYASVQGALIRADKAARRRSHDPDHLYLRRAADILEASMPLLLWLRVSRNLRIDGDIIRCAIELRSIYDLVVRRRFRLCAPGTCRIEAIDLRDSPAASEGWLDPFADYLAEIGISDAGTVPDPLDVILKFSEAPIRQHSFAVMHITQALERLVSRRDVPTPHSVSVPLLADGRRFAHV